MKSVAEKETTLFATHGYARCSTDEDHQDINRQVRELKAAGASVSGWNSSMGTHLPKSSRRPCSGTLILAIQLLHWKRLIFLLSQKIGRNIYSRCAMKFIYLRFTA